MPKNLLNKINAYREFIEALDRAFHIVERNKEIKKLGLKYLYAIDFSEIFDYCIPFSKLFEHARFNIERKHKAQYRDRIALWLLFNTYEELILLPPHRIELNSHVKRIHEDARLGSQSLEKQILEGKAQLLKLDFMNEFDRLIKIWKMNKKLSEKDRDIFIDIVDNKFSEYKSIKTITDTVGLKKIAELFESGKLIDLSEKYKNFHIKDNVLKSQARPWFMEFQRRRPADEKDVANYMDALSCVFINELNNYFKKDESNLRIFFISRSSVMLDTLDSVHTINFKHTEIPVSLNLESILLQNLYNICEERNEYKNYNKLYEDFRFIKNNYEILFFRKNEIIAAGKLSEIENKIEGIYDIFNSDQNISYLLSEKHQTYLKKEIRTSEEEEFKKAMSLLISVFDSDVEFKRLIVSRLEQSSELLKNITQGLTEDLKQIKYLRYLKGIIRLESRKPTVVTLFGIDGEMPTALKFQDPNVIELAKRIFTEDRAFASLMELENSINKVRNMHDTEPSSEYAILLSYLEACVRHWDNAWRIIEFAPPPSTSTTEIEFQYFKSFLSRKSENTSAGIAACKKGLELDGNDSRILREYSVLLWQCYRNPELKVKIKKRLNINATRNLAIEVAKKALENTKHRDLKARCLNSLAYYYAESLRETDIKKAIEYNNQLSSYEGKITFPARFYDTRAYVLLRQSVILSKSKNEKMSLLERAYSESTKALKGGGIIMKELKTVVRHRFDILRHLEKLYSV